MVMFIVFSISLMARSAKRFSIRSSLGVCRVKVKMIREKKRTIRRETKPMSIDLSHDLQSFPGSPVIELFSLHVAKSFMRVHLTSIKTEAAFVIEMKNYQK